MRAPFSPHAAATMVVSDVLPKAPSKERGKVIFFPLNFWFVTNTSAAMGNFKLVFGSGNSDLLEKRALSARRLILWMVGV